MSVEMKWWYWNILSILENILVLILNVVRLSVYDCFSVIFDNICMERTWIRESSFNIEKGNVDLRRGGICVCVRSLWKIAEVRREGVESGYRTNGLITWAGLVSFAEISAPSLKRNKNQLCNYMTTEPAPLTGIPVLWCRDPGWKCSK